MATKTELKKAQDAIREKNTEYLNIDWDKTPVKTFRWQETEDILSSKEAKDAKAKFVKKA